MKRIAAATLALTLAACQTPPPAEPDRVLVELVFGTSIPGGGTVGEAEWRRYLDEVLARQTPGFTAIDCQGGWMDDGKVQREGCKLVLVLAERPDLPAIAEAVAEYRRRFSQESVLWMQRPCPAPRCRFE
ncbi:MAG: DUF3574 domain-containing protein [Alphaproteobacteria bacterium]|nr:DUF3574 domain-containing protein [Alphaproteobacteria bacterium]